MNSSRNILMVASENDGIAHCKVGGIGDVIRDVPAALAKQGCHTSIVTPSYGFLHKAKGGTYRASIHFSFSGKIEQAGLYRVCPRESMIADTEHYVIDHPSFRKYNAEKEQYEIYNDDPPGRPFATDATKFACFCATVSVAIRDNLFGSIDILHLHDWHAAFLLILRKYDPACVRLKDLWTVFTIHNLALQGIRPFEGDPSSLQTWYPTLRFGEKTSDVLRDPRWPDCINPMAAGVRLADAVHVVSPSYANEILKPSQPPQFFGGEGLDADLQRAMTENRLHGILNGCEYQSPRVPKIKITELLRVLKREIARSASRQSALSFTDAIAFQRVEKLLTTRKKPSFIAVSISRIVDQKMLLIKAAGSDGVSGIEHILKCIGPDKLYVLLGTGDRETEIFLTEMAAWHNNFLFINSYSNQGADALYASGNLFLMPSSFEPCGIGQMLAMRNGQPCLVHRTGGLRDTVKRDIDGFSFDGETLCEQVDAMIVELKRALHLYKTTPAKWETLCVAAANARFFWSDTAKQYLKQLYTIQP